MIKSQITDTVETVSKGASSSVSSSKVTGVANTAQPQVINPPQTGRLSHIAEGFRALRVRNYRLYWFGQLVSLTGNWMTTTAQSWLVYSLTHSPFALGFVTTLQFLPIMLFSLFGGVIADRVPKRRLLVVTQSLSLVQSVVFGYLAASGLLQVWHIYILAAAQGVINAIDNPTRQAFATELVGKEDRANSIALNSMLFNGARVVGPAVAGLLIARVGAATALYLDAVSYLGVIGALLAMNPAKFFTQAMRVKEAPLKELGDGLRYAWQTPAVLSILIVVAFIGTFGYNFSVVLPLLGGFVLHTDAEGFGALSAALGIGSLIGAVSIAYTKTLTMRRLLIGSTMFGILLGAVSLSSVMSLSQLILVGLGFFGILFSTSANTLLQQTVPDRLRGRVMSLFILLFAGSTPIGAFLIGTISNAFNVSTALVICSVLCVIGVGASAWYQHSVRGRQLESQPAV